MPSHSLAWIALALLWSPGCVGTLTLAGGDGTHGDDDSEWPGDDDTATPSDDDDSTGIPADDDTTPDTSTLQGTRVVHLDFSSWAEDSWGLLDCLAPYALHGPAVTADYQDLCEACDLIYRLTHEPDPPEAVESCVSQAYWETATFERLYGLEMTTDTEFVLWRNVGQVDAPLQEYGSGWIDGASLGFVSDTEDHEWYSYWAEGEGTFGP